MFVASRRIGAPIHVGESFVAIGEITRRIIEGIDRAKRPERIGNVVGARPVLWVLEDVTGLAPLQFCGLIS